MMHLGCELGGVGVMRHHHHGLAELLVQTPQNCEHFERGGGVQVAGGLICEYRRRAGDDGACHGGALLRRAGLRWGRIYPAHRLSIGATGRDPVWPPSYTPPIKCSTVNAAHAIAAAAGIVIRSEEHTSELQSPMY